MATGNGTGHLGAALLAMVPGLLAAVSAQAGNTIAVTVGPPVTVLSPAPEFIPAPPPPTAAPPGGVAPAAPAPLPPQAIRVAPPVVVPLPDPVGQRGSRR